MNYNAAHSGQFAVGSALVNRLGFGAMRITGAGIWGWPQDRDNALAVLRRARDIGITLIDTADSYGPNVSEQLIAEALYPYDGLLIATKGGLTRPGPDRWTPNGRPEYLRTCVEGSLRRLRLNQLPLWQLHRIDPAVPRADQFGVIAAMRDEGLIKDVGLSQVSVEDIDDAFEYFPVSTVQNLYNLSDRTSEDVLRHCEARNIGFIPWYPLGAGNLAKSQSKIEAIAGRNRATPSQIALAWLLARSPVILPIPGTANLSHLEENVGSAGFNLSDADFRSLDEMASHGARRITA